VIKDDPTKIKHPLRKNISLLLSCTFIKHVRFYLPLPISVTVSIFHSKCLYLPHIQSSSLPFHSIALSVSSTALDIQHFLKPFTVTSGEKYCHAVMIHTD
jgi:hypothetical protein